MCKPREQVRHVELCGAKGPMWEKGGTGARSSNNNNNNQFLILLLFQLFYQHNTAIALSDMDAQGMKKAETQNRVVPSVTKPGSAVQHALNNSDRCTTVRIINRWTPPPPKFKFGYCTLRRGIRTS